MKTSTIVISSLPLSAAFAPQSNGAGKTSLHAELAVVPTVPSASNPIHDPLGLYPANSPERVGGLIAPLESAFVDDARTAEVISDPLGLYSDQSAVSSVEMSRSLPFLPRPALLDGATLPGDRGFDPFNFASDPASLRWQRKAEAKHARLAMLAAAGWPVAELVHGNLASALGLPSMLASGDRVPSVLNDGLAHATSYPLFWIAAIASAAAVEFGEIARENVAVRLDPSDLGFDPLGLGGETEERNRFMREAEIFNGRLGMLAIVGFAVQEKFLGSAVVDQVPGFFRPLHVALEQLTGAQ